MKRNLIALSTVALVVFFGPQTAQFAQSTSNDCPCNPPKNGETTHWVGNQVTIFVEKDSHGTLRGTVAIFPGVKPLSGALDEVFTDPEYLLSRNSYSQGNPNNDELLFAEPGLTASSAFWVGSMSCVPAATTRARGGTPLRLTWSLTVKKESGKIY